MGKFNLAMGITPEIAEQIDLSQNHRILDLGGGPGTFAIHFCLANPGLDAVIYDRPTMQFFAMETVAKFGLKERIEFMYRKNKVSVSIILGSGCQMKTNCSYFSRSLLTILASVF